MVRRRRRAARLAAIGGLMVGLALAEALPARAITAAEKARLDKGAQQTLEELDSLLKDVAADDRKACALGGGPRPGRANTRA